ncbi:MAG: N-acetyltransferase [Planctomycetes bacterium]|nr:N-acetyltransferase [Planctomycetota bacterium]
MRAVTLAAFPTRAEADLVDALRAGAEPFVSLVAEQGGAIVGHITFSPVTLDALAELRIAGLGPMAVAPAHQRRGIGSALVRAGLDTCRTLGFAAVVVLGHPGFYPRFGFAPSVRFGFRSEYDVPEDVFMALELVPGALRGSTGTARYHPAFGTL